MLDATTAVLRASMSYIIYTVGKNEKICTHSHALNIRKLLFYAERIRLPGFFLTTTTTLFLT